MIISKVFVSPWAIYIQYYIICSDGIDGEGSIWAAHDTGSVVH